MSLALISISPLLRDLVVPPLKELIIIAPSISPMPIPIRTFLSDKKFIISFILDTIL